MKLVSNIASRKAEAPGFRPPAPVLRPASGFTMIEIAISLAIIGIALVAIIGVLPLGMNVQRDNREQTIINQDASVFLNAISQGARGLDDLTNYVYAITNYWTEFDSKGFVNNSGGNGYTYSSFSIAPSYFSLFGSPINSGTNIIGLLGTPEYMDVAGNPTNNLFIFSTDPNGCYSNHVIAYVRSMSGSAGEKPPQDNDIIRADSFGYRLLCVNAAPPADTNIISLNSPPVYGQQLGANLHELRLTFFWPVLPNGGVGGGRQSYRATVAGQIVPTNLLGQTLYFYQPQSFAHSP